MSHNHRESAAATDYPEAGSPVAEMVDEAARALREVEPAAFLVQPRVLRRVIKQEWELPALTVQVPHRKSWIIPRNTLIRHVEWDELGIGSNAELPDHAILIARPDEKHLESMSLSELKRQLWRLLFHSKIHEAFDSLRSEGPLSAADFRQRIDQLGQVEFDEISTVLRRENFTYAETSLTEVYVEFVALYCELKHFAPHCLGACFPSFAGFSRVDRLIQRDIDVEPILNSTRLPGSPDPVEDDGQGPLDETDDELEALTGHISEKEFVAHLIPSSFESGSDGEPDRFPPLLDDVLPKVDRASRPNLRTFGRIIRKADRAFARGNAVGAALWQIRAAKFATPELVNEAVGGALTDLQRLVRRLQQALDFDHVAARCWYESLVTLLIHAEYGFWNPDKRLLHDLQKVCVDHERDIYTVDVIGWATSFGQRAVKRELPNQREVLMSKHLRSATRRLVSSKLAGLERRRLSHLLHEAAQSAERQMRTRLRPLTVEALENVQLVPHNVPERVAFAKLVEELLDGVAHRGFLTMGDMRDAVSRSNLKLQDMTGPVEFVSGDKLLRADYRLSRVLDGVYQRGDFYLRWLQRLSAAGFGTRIGRFLTRYVVIPYGVAYLMFEAVVHVAEKLVPHGSEDSEVEPGGTTGEADVPSLEAADRADRPAATVAPETSEGEGSKSEVSRDSEASRDSDGGSVSGTTASRTSSDGTEPEDSGDPTEATPSRSPPPSPRSTGDAQPERAAAESTANASQTETEQQADTGQQEEAEQQSETEQQAETEQQTEAEQSAGSGRAVSGTDHAESAHQTAVVHDSAYEAAMHAVREQTPEIVFVLGTFLLLVIHVASFRQFLRNVFGHAVSGMRRALYEWPVRFIRQPLVRRILKSPVTVYFRKFLLWPLIPTALICGLLPRLYESVPKQPWSNWLIVLAAMSVILNSRVGRDVEELSAEWLYSTWTRIRVHVLVALYDLVMESFKRLIEWFERVLYAVDEWLRFKSGETALSLGLKAVAGVFWSGFTFVARFCVNLLIEPQINPIKHFPVVTVSHKLLLPLTPTLIAQVAPIVDSEELATAIVGSTIFVIPGAFGFMAWELKSNWRLYRANRSKHLKPVIVGSHGETFIRLMKPGFHSGTLPKVFSRLRRIDRRRGPKEHSQQRSKYLDQLHHVHVAVEHFVQRELLQLLHQAPAWNSGDLQLSRFTLASNNIRIFLARADAEAEDAEAETEPLLLAFEEQSGWLVAGVYQTGWVNQLDPSQRDVLRKALAGFYKLSGVDMVREHVEGAFAPRRLPYDVTEEGLVVWPDGKYDEEAVYNLWHRHTIRPYPRSVARKYQLPVLTSEHLLYGETDVSWPRWESLWEGETESRTPLLPEHARWTWPESDRENGRKNQQKHP